MLDKHLIVHCEPVANEENIVCFGNYRVTVLADRLFRVEKDSERVFCDEATQSVWFRNAKKQRFSVKQSETAVRIKTPSVTLVLDMEFEKSYVVIDGRRKKINNDGNLMGTYRTLDGYKGNKSDWSGRELPIEYGVLSRTGVAVVDDTKSLILGEDGKIHARREMEMDLYVFAYGTEYREALCALYEITGAVPKIPKYALGNWWSRYYAYTDKSYLHLLDKFEDKDIPLTVATIDMDWHYSTKIPEEFNIPQEILDDPDTYGIDPKDPKASMRMGWTGYSWNKHLFPDYKAFLKKIQEKNLKITLNLHPADGVRYFEDCYEDMAKAMGIDPATKQRIPFDVTSDEFINNYFRILHKPYEHDGVYFWWMDWQQGTKTALAGLDPLWSLNHYHYLDNGLEHEPLLLSRYCGVGSHRYPLGFSGDTIMAWESLDYIPYFTLTASNVGYTWWSHDIGAHFRGYKDDELYCRYVQFGVFSPINRLHCVKQEIDTKEPWSYSNGTCEIAERFLRLRHRMLPYLYSASIKNHKLGLSLVEPMYYEYPEAPEAYRFKNQYMFGGELLVAPITKKMGKDKCVAHKVWFPEGVWTDIFTGDVYEGGRVIEIVRTLDTMPVFAKAGGVFPTCEDKKGNSLDNPTKLRLDIFNGNGVYDMYEDLDGKEAVTTVANTAAEGKQITKITVSGDADVIPADREYRICFRNVETGSVKVTVDGNLTECFVDDNDFLEVIVKPETPASEIVVEAEFTEVSALARAKRMATNALRHVEGDNAVRAKVYYGMLSAKTAEEYKQAVAASEIRPIYKKRLLELIK